MFASLIGLLAKLLNRSQPVQKQLPNAVIDRLQSDLDAIQSLLNEVRADFNNEVSKVEIQVKPTSQVTLAPVPVKNTEQHQALENYKNRVPYYSVKSKRVSKTGIKRFRMERIVQNAILGKRVPLDSRIKLLTTKQLAKRWQCTPDAVANWCSAGKLKAEKQHNHYSKWLIDADYVRDFEQKLHDNPIPDANYFVKVINV